MSRLPGAPPPPLAESTERDVVAEARARHAAEIAAIPDPELDPPKRQYAAGTKASGAHPRLTAEQREEIAELRLCGWTYRRIAGEMGIAESSVAYVLQRREDG